MSDVKETGQELAQKLASEFVPGDKWTHFKGGVYEIVTLGVKEDTGEVMVVYKSLKYATVWIRTLDEFTGYTTRPDGNTYKRFTKGAS